MNFKPRQRMAILFGAEFSRGKKFGDFLKNVRSWNNSSFRATSCIYIGFTDMLLNFVGITFLTFRYYFPCDMPKNRTLPATEFDENFLSVRRNKKYFVLCYIGNRLLSVLRPSKNYTFSFGRYTGMNFGGHNRPELAVVIGNTQNFAKKFCVLWCCRIAAFLTPLLSSIMTVTVIVFLKYLAFVFMSCFNADLR